MRQPSFDLRRDQSDSVKVLYVNAVFQPVAGELHANEILDGSKKDTLSSGDGWRVGNYL